MEAYCCVRTDTCVRAVQYLHTRSIQYNEALQLVCTCIQRSIAARVGSRTTVSNTQAVSDDDSRAQGRRPPRRVGVRIAIHIRKFAQVCLRVQVNRHNLAPYGSRSVNVLLCLRTGRYKLSESGISKEAAYQIIHDDLLLDCNPRLNLASFVTTWMEPECDKLIMESLNKNYIDIEEYPITNDLQVQCCITDP